jgi:hypothetical protein
MPWETAADRRRPSLVPPSLGLIALNMDWTERHFARLSAGDRHPDMLDMPVIFMDISPQEYRVIREERRALCHRCSTCA